MSKKLKVRIGTINKGIRSNLVYGIFAACNIKKGSIVFEVKGKVVEGDLPYEIGECWFQIGKNKWISPSPRNPGRFINHSCNPNVGIKASNKGKSLLMIALRNITQGEEIAYDYAMSDWDWGWAMPCFCEEPNCRKTIRGYKYLPTKIKKKYSGYITPFLLDMEKT
jgi:hypothetical protein